MAASITVKGLIEAVARLRKFPGQMESGLGPVLLDGAEVMSAAIKTAVPVDSGATQRAIVAKLTTSRRTGLPIAYAALDTQRLTKRDAKGKIVRYPYFVHYGTRAHTIKAGPGKALGIGGRAVQSVNHPGSRPSRFFSRGLARGRYHTKEALERGAVILLRRLGAE